MGFKIRSYKIESKKLNDRQEIRIVFLSDLHLIEHGKNNHKLISVIHTINPDIILVGGDMVVGKEECSEATAEYLLTKLASDYKILYALGNHEQKLKQKKERFGERYTLYQERLAAAGVCFLDNRRISLSIKGKTIVFHGLNLPLKYYKRFERHQLLMDEIQSYLGIIDDSDTINILLAHHPRYADVYFAWGADLILSGHVHGGVMRFGKKALISPDIQLFPKYGYGKIKRGDQTMIISGGIGEHTIPFRFFNPRELVLIEIK